MHTATKRHLDRRAFLRGSGAMLSLPFLEAMVPAFATRAQAAVANPPPRFLAMCATLGFHTPFLFPQETGANYTLTPYLEPLKDLKNDFTVISGLQHEEQNGANGHTSEMTWLTSAKHPGLAGFKNNISIDQHIAERIGSQTHPRHGQRIAFLERQRRAASCRKLTLESLPAAFCRWHTGGDRGASPPTQARPQHPRHRHGPGEKTAWRARQARSGEAR
jgi:hypothetical protein